jgi:hypothetical protein
MKKFLFIGAILFLIFAIKNNYSQLLLEENFNYTAGDSLGAHGWISFSGGNTNVLGVVSPGLTYTGYPSSGIGNATLVRNTGQDAYKGFTPDSVTAMYASFMIKIDTAKTGDYFFAFLPSTSTTIYTCRVYVRDTAGTVSFGLSKFAASQGPIVYSSQSVQIGTTYVVVVKYKWLPGTNLDDEASLYVFTAPNFPATEPGTPTIGPLVSTGTGTDVGNLGRVALRQGTNTSSPTVYVDGIRVSKTWSSLVAVQNISSEVPSSFTLKQNYPNPFNPSTTIEFAVKTRSFVTLDVFDALGRNITSLVNEKLNAGSYKVNFNAASLSSGVYYYKLNAFDESGNSFVNTKSMILVK